MVADNQLEQNYARVITQMKAELEPFGVNEQNVCLLNKAENALTFSPTVSKSQGLSVI